MPVIYSGPTGSGKTTKLLGKYTEICKREGTDRALVFVKNAASRLEWQRNVDLEIMGKLNVFTYFGFVQKELTDYWPWVEERLPGGYTTIVPTFMNVETSHYLMSKYVEKHRKYKDVFEYVNATSPRIAVQLIDNLNQAAMNNLTLKDLQKRLLILAGDDREKMIVFNEAISIMQTFRKFCLENRILDYSLTVELYNNYLFKNRRYQEELKKRYNYLFVDNLEKSVPTAQKLFLYLLENLPEVYLSFNPEEGINRFFGGNPQLARESFFPLCEVEELRESYTSSPAARRLAASLCRSIFEDISLKDNSFIMKEINTELRGDMLNRTGGEVVKLLADGLKPSDIVLVAPQVDKVMEFTLERYITGQGYSFVNLTRTKRLVDLPFSQALIVLTLLANPQWQMQINYSALQQTMSLLLKLDPVRSSLLAEEIIANKMLLPELADMELRARIGFDNSARYDYLREWLQEKENQVPELEEFFQLVFAELLSPLSPSHEDILACRQMIDSITKFKKVVMNFKDIPEEEMGKHFIDLIYNGTLAAEVLYNNIGEEAVILTTPYKFLFSPEIKSVKYLFLLDISSENWLRGLAKELFNPYILSPQWGKNNDWNDSVDQELRKEQLAAYLQSILSKVTDGIYLADSYLNSRGWEQEGQLAEWLLVI